VLYVVIRVGICGAVFWDVSHVALVPTDVSEEFVFLRCLPRLLFTAEFPDSPILVTLMMEALRSSEMSVITGATRRHVPGDHIVRVSHCSWN
jgi:hypothetical protein